MEYLGIAVNLEISAPTQYQGFNFNSICQFNGAFIGSSENGLFTIGTNDYDEYVDAGDYSEINAFIELGPTDFGYPNAKRPRFYYIGYESNGDLLVSVTKEEGTARSFTLSPVQGSQKQEGVRIPIGSRGGKGRYWHTKIANVSGCDFSIDSIDVSLIFSGRKPAGT